MPGHYSWEFASRSKHGGKPTGGGGSGGAGAPLSLVFDAQTPEQISIRAPLSRAVATGTTVDAEYKLASSSTWIPGGRLFRLVAQAFPTAAPVVDSFAGCVFDLTSGQTYDIRLTVTEPGQSVVQVTGTQSTRALPAAAPTPNKSATPATFAAQLLTLVAGDCLQLADGTYSAFTLANSGTSGSPIYIRGTSRTGTIISAPTGTAITWSASHVVLENLTMQGSGVDAGTPAISDTSLLSAGITFSTGGSTQTNATIRNITATGFDRFCKAFAPVNGRLVYNCTITGNNTWALTYGSPINVTWSDDGVSGPGQGNCFFDSTITGHGDTFKIESSLATSTYYSAAVFMYRIACGRTGDDFAETDEGAGNIGIYDCYVKNAGTGLSVDGVYGGPVYFFRNRVGNTTRGPIKPTSDSQNVCIVSNTWLRTQGQNDGVTTAGQHNFQAATSAANDNWIFKNNLIVYRGANDVIRWDCTLGGLDWDYNATYPSTGRNYTLGAGRGGYTGLTAAKAALTPLMAHDIATVTNPFAATITLGSDYSTEYTGSVDWTLAGGATALNAGVALPNITDGFTGAAPDIGAVITGRGIASAGDASSLPAWISSQTLNTWGVLPTSNTLDSLNPDNTALVNPNYPSAAPWRPAGSHAGIINAWCGAVPDLTNSKLHWINSGGHGDGYPAASYALNLNASTPSYTRTCTPSGAVGRTALDYTAAAFTGGGSPLTTQLDANGRHRAQHTESFQVYWPGQGIATLSGILLAPTGGSTTTGVHPYVTDPATGELVGSLGTAMSAANVGSGAFAAACYDSTRGVAWMKASSTDSKFSKWGGPASDGWTDVGSTTYYLSGGISMGYSPSLDLILVGNGDNSGDGVRPLSQTIVGGFGVMDPATGTLYAQGLTGTYPTFTGAPAINVAWSTGLCPGLCLPQWDATLGAFLAWDMSTGSTTQIMRITPPAVGDARTGTWTVDYLTVAGSNAVTPSVAQINGTYGRFAVYPDLGICVVVNAVTEAGYFFRYR